MDAPRPSAPALPDLVPAGLVPAVGGPSSSPRSATEEGEVALDLLVTGADPPGLAALAGRAAEGAGMAWRRLVVDEPHDPPGGIESGAAAVITLLSSGAAAWLTGAGPQTPHGLDGRVVVVAEDPRDAVVLHHALALGAAAVLDLADELAVLQQVRLARDASARRELRPGIVVAVRPVVGGAGASCLAATLAQVAAAVPNRRRGPGPRGTTLVDADAHGAVELLLGDPWSHDDEQGPGWRRLATLDGQVDPAWLRDRLPLRGRLRVVGHGAGPRHPPPASRLGLVVDAAAAAGDLVVVDVPPPGRSAPGADPLPGGGAVQHELWVVPCTAPAVAAAARQLGEVEETTRLRRSQHQTAAGQVARRWLVARRARAGLHPEAVAATLGLRLAADVRHDPRIDEHVALGLGAAPRRGSAYARAARSVLSALEHADGREGAWTA